MTNRDPASHDRYVRIPETELSGIPLIHFTSAIDMSIGPMDQDLPDDTITGYTEWTAVWRDQEISLGWDWALVGDTLVLINPNEVRSNVLLLGPDGAPYVPAMTRALLAQWIRSLPWGEGTVREVALQYRSQAH